MEPMKQEPGEWRFTLAVIQVWRDEDETHQAFAVNRWAPENE